MELCIVSLTSRTSFVGLAGEYLEAEGADIQVFDDSESKEGAQEAETTAHEAII